MENWKQRCIVHLFLCLKTIELKIWKVLCFEEYQIQQVLVNLLFDKNNDNTGEGILQSLSHFCSEDLKLQLMRQISQRAIIQTKGHTNKKAY